jgi:hypothetical protein
MASTMSVPLRFKKAQLPQKLVSWLQELLQLQPSGLEWPLRLSRKDLLRVGIDVNGKQAVTETRNCEIVGKRDLNRLRRIYLCIPCGLSYETESLA